MNKKLLVAAIGAAIAAGPILAQAEVKVYGHAHMSVDMVDYDEAAAATDDGGLFVSSNSSRFGIRASEDLGGGLKGVVQYEVLLQQDENAGTSTNRDNYIGLEGGFGALRIGNIDSATKDIGGISDLFYREQIGEHRSVTNAGSGGLPDTRLANTITYLSPNFSGVTFKAQYGADENTDENVIAANVRYAAGPLTAGFGYMTVEAADPLEDTDVMRVAAKYALGGGFTVAALYQTVDAIGGVDGADRDAYGIGASFKTGNNVFKAQYYVADELDNADDTGGDLIAIGWDHLFSKTTIGYITYAATSNDDNVNTFQIGGIGHDALQPAANVAAGGDTSAFSVGMIVNF